jgi:MFS superfamily sulfate permease-like transporter
MRIGGFDFSLREFAGSLGDFGTLIPFLTGYVLVNGFDPSGVLIMLGLTNIFLAFVYRLPLPVQPKKAVGSIAIANSWTPGMVYGTGLGLGVFWLILGLSRRVNEAVQKVPKSVTRGVQFGLCIILVLKAIEFMKVDVLVALVSAVIIVSLLKNRWMPSAIAVLLFGVIVSFLRNDIRLSALEFGFFLPKLYVPTLSEMATGFLLAGIAQIPLTLTNAVIATTTLLKDYFPKREVKPRSLILNMGFMNVFTALFGGMPLCHGSGGLASQYLYGARTGGALIMEGAIEIFLGLFLADSVGSVFKAFPLAVLGAMLLFAGLELGRIAFKIRGRRQILIVLVTGAVSAITNLAFGFASGLAIYVVLEAISRRERGEK